MFQTSTICLLLCLLSAAVAFKSFRPAVVAKSSSLNAIKLVCNDDEPIESVLRRFKRSVNQSGHLMELRHRELWETAADKRKRKAEKARQMNRIERTNDRYERRADGTGEYSS